jgi:hypothetical protein
MFLLALILPCIYFILTGNIIRGIFALCLMLWGFFSLGFGWIVASIWAIMFRNDKIRKEELKETRKQMKELKDAVKESKKD